MELNYDGNVPWVNSCECGHHEKKYCAKVVGAISSGGFLVSHKLSCLLAELVDDGFKDKHRSSWTNHSQRLSGEHVIRDSTDGATHQALHCRLRSPTVHAFKFKFKFDIRFVGRSYTQRPWAPYISDKHDQKVYSWAVFKCISVSNVMEIRRKIDPGGYGRNHALRIWFYTVSQNRPTFTTCYNFYIYSSIVTIFAQMLPRK